MFALPARYLRQAGWTDWDLLQAKTSSGVVWWIFRKGQEIPAVAGKFCSGPAADAGRRECAVLQSLQPYAAQLGIPQVLFQAETREGFVYLQSGMPGKPLPDELSPSDDHLIAAQFALIEPWLEKFQTVVPRQGDAASAFRQMLAPVSGRLPQPLLAAAQDALPPLATVPAVAVHGDFWAHNVLAAPGRVSVVDWNTFHHGAPIEDLFNFAVGVVYRTLPAVEQSAGIIWNVFFGSSPLAVRTRAATARTLARWGLSPDLLRPLFLMSLISRLGRTEFSDNPAWHAVAARYVTAGCPTPWDSADSRAAA